MRNLIFWAVTAILLLGALSATVSMATVRWLYPDTSPPASSKAGSTPAAKAQPKQSSTPAGAGQSTPYTPPPLTSQPGPPATPDELLALDVIHRAGTGDLAGARSLSHSIPAEVWEELERVRPSPGRAVTLPGPEGGPVQVLVWTQYRREGALARGAYQVAISGTKVLGITGPFAPSSGYRSLPFKPLDERARPVDMSKFEGRGLLLVTPRLPEADLVPLMNDLQREYSPRGVEVILLLDTLSPNWVTAARRFGYTGLIWRVKGRVDEIPVVTRGGMLGAIGLLVDRQGTVVSSLAALDPSRYSLPDKTVPEIAAQVLRVYGLLP